MNRADSGFLIPDSLIPEEKHCARKRGKPRQAAATDDARFDRFWADYPCKKGKEAAIKAWNSLAPNDVLVATIMAALERQKRSEQWLRNVIPHGSTWLNGRRWEDVLDLAQIGYEPADIAVITAYNAILAAKGWPKAVADPYSADRAIAIGQFLGFGEKPGWIERYFTHLATHLEAKTGLGFDWSIQRATYLRAREGNFAPQRTA